MDLGLAGKKAIVCGSSHGLGRACALALAQEGVAVVVNGRHLEDVEAAAAEISLAAGGPVTRVVADVASSEGRALLLAACPEPDILINNCGGPPAGDFRDFSQEDWLAALNANMLSAIDLIKATLDGMQARGFGRVVNITSGAVKAPIAGLDLSSGARCGLTGVVAGLARVAIRQGVTMNNLLPGTFSTRRIEEYYRKMAALEEGVSWRDLQARDMEGHGSVLGDEGDLSAMHQYKCGKVVGVLVED